MTKNLRNVPQLFPGRMKPLSMTQPSSTSRIARFFAALFGPIREAKIADLITSHRIREEVQAFPLSALEIFYEQLSIDPRIMEASFTPCKDMILLKPINQHEFSFTIIAKVVIKIRHDHVGAVSAHDFRMAGTIRQDREIVWDHITLL